VPGPFFSRSNPGKFGHTRVIATNGVPKVIGNFRQALSRTLVTIAERISHSHPALTVAGATRIEHHCGTCDDTDAADFLFRFTCSHGSADTSTIFPVQ